MLWILLTVFLWGIVHSLLASILVKDFVRIRLGSRWMRFYRLFFNIFAIISFLPTLGLAFFTPDRTLYVMTFPWFVLMVFGELLSLFGLAVGFLQTDPWEFIGLRQLGESEGSSHLITSGLYRYVRHPLYTAGLLLIWLLPRMTINLLVVNIALTVYILIGALFEERKLKRLFGQAYLDYSSTTPMLIPFLKIRKSS